jgi:hypothetical protein
MATTSSNLVAGTALTGQGGKGNNNRYGLKSKVLAGVAVLGCVAALVFGGLRSSHSGQSQAQAGATAPIVQTDLREQQRFLEQNLNLPTAGTDLLVTATPNLDWETIRFIEANQLPEITNAAPNLDWSTIQFIEQNQLPEIANTPPDSCQPGQVAPCYR